MSDTELVGEVAREIEMLLERRFGAHGHGLLEKMSSVETSLTPRIVSRVRFIASVQDILAQESGATIGDPREFNEARHEVIDWLQNSDTNNTSARRPWHKNGNENETHSNSSTGRGKGMLLLPIIGFAVVILSLVLIGARSLEKTHYTEPDRLSLPQINR